jgi:phenylalanine-4-hydroxylase
MEFQAYNVLVIASFQPEHIEYTPAPDIIHEGAGHAPIIANPEYAEYLRRLEIGCKAISSHKDYEMYEAIRLFDCEEAEERHKLRLMLLKNRVENLQTYMELFRWHVPVDGGLLMERWKIQILDCCHLLAKCALHTPEVTKIPYDISAATQNFDITKLQPQLYVTPTFAYLNLVLEEFANKMALRTGLSGINKLIDSNALGTIELSTGLQISGFSARLLSKDQFTYKQLEKQRYLPRKRISRTWNFDTPRRF